MYTSYQNESLNNTLPTMSTKRGINFHHHLLNTKRPRHVTNPSPVYIQFVDTSSDGILISDGIIISPDSILALTGFIRYT